MKRLISIFYIFSIMSVIIVNLIWENLKYHHGPYFLVYTFLLVFLLGMLKIKIKDNIWIDFLLPLNLTLFFLIRELLEKNMSPHPYIWTFSTVFLFITWFILIIKYVEYKKLNSIVYHTLYYLLNIMFLFVSWWGVAMSSYGPQ